jgi:hypothetical protein
VVFILKAITGQNETPDFIQEARRFIYLTVHAL